MYRNSKTSVITLVVVLTVGLCTLSIYAQEQTPSKEAKAPVSTKVIGGGGPMPGLVFLELPKVNEILGVAGYPTLRNTIFTMGGGGFGGEIDGFRFGGIGYGGDRKVDNGDKSVKLTFGFGGFLIEKGIFSGSGYSGFIGAVIGGGGVDLDLVSEKHNTLEQAVNNPSQVSLSRSFFGVQAYTGFDFSVWDWLFLKVKLGYIWTLPERWKQSGSPLTGPPNNLNAQIIQVMISFGGRSVENNANMKVEREG